VRWRSTPRLWHSDRVDEPLSAQAFYDGLAADYHLLFDDWREAAVRHGDVIGEVLRELRVGPGARLLDCTCGIGTQAIPLAARGYRVIGTDASAEAVARARSEAERWGVTVDLATCDVRDVGSLGITADAVLACDNSLAHLLTEDSLLSALRSIRACLSPGGAFVASFRDYDGLCRDRPTGTVPVVHSSDDRQAVVGQAWSWSDDANTVLIRLFVLEEGDGGWSCSVLTTRLRAWKRADVDAALPAAGFDDVRWLLPDHTGYYQPIVTAIAI
jgi:glycine/sarcosine N-methyltransferase